MKTVEFQLKEEIMATNTYLCISSDVHTEEEMAADISTAINTLKKFSNTYSRFIQNNALDQFNNSAIMHLTPEFYDILKKAYFYYEFTQGIFDPTILDYLLDEGYNVSKNEGFYKKGQIETGKSKKYTFKDIDLTDIKNVTKPKELKIDLGGIGKGYAVDIIKNQLITKYKSFCIDLGGDMYLSGGDEKNFYNFWAIEIENPILNNTKAMPMLMIKDMAVATSGINKRNWIINGEIKNHIINPVTGQSIKNDLTCVTVFGPDAVYTDVLAKTLLIMGLEDGRAFAKKNNIPAVFIDNKLNAKITEYAEEYIWK